MSIMRRVENQQQRQSGQISQRGIGLVGMLGWACLIASAAVLTGRWLPTLLEFYTIQRIVDRIAQDNPATLPEVRVAFDQARQVEYSVRSISGQDLLIARDNDKLQIGFAYDKQIEIAGPVSLLIKYQGHSH